MFVCQGGRILFIRSDEYSFLICPKGINNVTLSEPLVNFFHRNSINRKFICFPESEIDELCYLLAIVELKKHLHIKSIYDLWPLLIPKLKAYKL